MGFDHHVPCLDYDYLNGNANSGDSMVCFGGTG